MILNQGRNKIAIYLIWVVAALFTSTQLYLKTLDAGGTDSWSKLFFIQFLVWNVWGAMSPLIFWLGKKFRIDRQTYYRGLFVHIILAIAVVLTYLAVYSIIWNFLGMGKFNFQVFSTYFKVFFLNLFHWHFFIYMAIIGLAHAMEYQRELKEQRQEAIELERALFKNELDMLKAQLSPHFLFNTINNVVSTIEQGKNSLASGMLIRLGEFLRICLEESKHQLIPLKKELGYVKKYLEIEQFRNAHLRVNIQSDNEHGNTMVPSFILQPIVENAIQHGISKNESANYLEIGSDLQEDVLILSVYNEGPSLPIEKNRKKGIGLENTAARLKKSFGDKAHIELFSVNDGVMVEIHIPIEQIR